MIITNKNQTLRHFIIFKSTTLTQIFIVWSKNLSCAYHNRENIIQLMIESLKTGIFLIFNLIKLEMTPTLNFLKEFPISIRNHKRFWYLNKLVKARKASSQQSGIRTCHIQSIQKGWGCIFESEGEVTLKVQFFVEIKCFQILRKAVWEI